MKKTSLITLVLLFYCLTAIGQEQRTAPTSDEKVFIDFVGSGDIQKSISQGSDITANTGLGIIYERYRGDDRVLQSFELEGVINIATTADTVKAQIDGTDIINARDFGTYILNPVSAKQSLYLNTNWFFGYPEDRHPKFAGFAKVVSGANVRVISSNKVWQADQSNFNLGVLALRAGVFHEFLPDNYRLTKEGRVRYSIFLGLNYAYRGLLGDIASNKYKAEREELLSNSATNFHGLEANFGFRLKNLRAEFQMPMLKSKGAGIDGLTGTQFLFSIKFVGGFSLKVTDREEDEEND